MCGWIAVSCEYEYGGYVRKAAAVHPPLLPSHPFIPSSNTLHDWCANLDLTKEVGPISTFDLSDRLPNDLFA